MAESTQSLPPVNERMTAPELHRPSHPLIAEWRPIAPDDLDAVLELLQAMDAVDHPNYLTTREELEDEFAFTFVQLETDSLLGLTADGRAVAAALIVVPPLQETLVRAYLEGGVHPDVRGRGIGRELLAWQRTRAEQLLATSTKRLPAWILAYADARAPQTEHLLQRGGFEIARYFSGLERDLSAPIDAVDPAEGIRIVPFTEERSAAAHAARTDSFRDHWGSQPMSEEQWHSWLGGTFDAGVSFLAVADDPEAPGGEQVVGFALCQVNEDDWASQGFTGAYLGMVGTTRAYRGRRIAPALLSRVLTACAARGWERVTLDVDSESPTGALGLYTRMGFVPTNSETALTRVY